MKEYYKDDWATIYHGDCMEVMPYINTGLIDIVLCDLPYGITGNSWDVVIPFSELWKQYYRLCKGPIVLTASQPFTSMLVCSALQQFKQELIWEKTRSSNPMIAKFGPLRVHESICIFSFGECGYIPKMEEGGQYAVSKYSGGRCASYANVRNANFRGSSSSGRHPRSVVKITNSSSEAGSHPTQKPLALMTYLLELYSREGCCVLDNCAGSGTTLRAAKDLRRKSIGIEIEERYCEIAAKRLAQEVLAL